MKSLFKTLLVLLTTLSLFSCDKKTQENSMLLSQVITLPNGDEIRVDDSFVHEELQGIDTSVGKLVSEYLGMEIFYDIGFLAGEYVDATSSTCDMAVNSTFCWRSDTTQILATFRDLGPANFASLLGNDSLFLEIMKTMEDK